MGATKCTASGRIERHSAAPEFTDFGPQRSSTQISTQRGGAAESRCHISWSRRPTGTTDQSVPPAFQAGHAGSIPVARSDFLMFHYRGLMAESAILTDSGVSGRRLVVVFGAGLLAATVPAAAVFVWFVSALGGGRHVDVLFTALAVGWTVLTVGVPAVVISRVARRHGVRVSVV